MVHGDTRTTYEPVRATVSVGDEVAAGQPIGLLEVGGSHCFPTACLHWGWLRGRTYLDPLLLDFDQPVAKLRFEDGTWTGLYRHVLKVFLLDGQNRVRNVYSTGFLNPPLVLNDVRTLLAETPTSGG